VRAEPRHRRHIPARNRIFPLAHPYLAPFAILLAPPTSATPPSVAHRPPGAKPQLGHGARSAAMDPPPAEESRQRAPNRGGKARQHRLGLKKGSIAAPSPPLGSSLAPPPVRPPPPISSQDSPTPTPTAPTPTPGVPSSSPAAPTSTVPPRPPQRTTMGRHTPKFCIPSWKPARLKFMVLLISTSANS
jgi:hypothetical protein